ncbi:MAG: glycoside hydrolase N-terminal domain-containing protein, partial [Thermodesulfobacteriota bacterium]
MVLEGEIAEARKFGIENMTQSPTSYRSYEPLGTLSLQTKLSGDVENYRRELDLKRGVATVSFKCGETKYTREYFIS